MPHVLYHFNCITTNTTQVHPEPPSSHRRLLSQQERRSRPLPRRRHQPRRAPPQSQRRTARRPSPNPLRPLPRPPRLLQRQSQLLLRSLRQPRRVPLSQLLSPRQKRRLLPLQLSSNLRLFFLRPSLAVSPRPRLRPRLRRHLLVPQQRRPRRLRQLRLKCLVVELS